MFRKNQVQLLVKSHKINKKGEPNHRPVGSLFVGRQLESVLLVPDRFLYAISDELRFP